MEKSITLVYPYKMASESAKSLAESLGCKRLKLQGSKFKGSPNKVLVNWGNSSFNNCDNKQELEKCIIMNEVEKVAEATDKLRFFNKVIGKVRIPEYTIDHMEARQWHADGFDVVGRAILNGHSGQGITLVKAEEPWDVPHMETMKLYVKYVPKKQEYRIHVVGGQVVMMQRKVIRSDYPKNLINHQIRNLNGGYLYAKNEGKNPPKDVFDQALLAIECAELDFGAVDVIYNELKKEAYVLEINTAPGLSGTSPDTYAEALSMYAQLLSSLKENNADEVYKKYRHNLKAKNGQQKALYDLGALNQPDWDALFTAGDNG